MGPSNGQAEATDLIARLCHGLIQGKPIEAPGDFGLPAVKMDYATQLADAAEDFALAHELGHVTEWLRRGGDPGEDIPPEEEYAADQNALETVIDIGAPWPGTWRDAYAGAELALRIYGSLEHLEFKFKETHPLPGRRLEKFRKTARDVLASRIRYLEVSSIAFAWDEQLEAMERKIAGEAKAKLFVVGVTPDRMLSKLSVWIEWMVKGEMTLDRACNLLNKLMAPLPDEIVRKTVQEAITAYEFEVGMVYDKFVPLNSSDQQILNLRRAQRDVFWALKGRLPNLFRPSRLNEWREEVCVNYLEVGNKLSALGNLADALESYRSALEVAENAAGGNPSASWQRALSVSHLSVGDGLSALGDPAGALKSYRNSLEIAEELAKQDPGNEDWQWDRCASYLAVGDALSALRDPANALRSYRNGFEIAENAAKKNPVASWWRSQLSVSYLKVGDALSALGNLADALKSYCDSLEIAKKLTNQTPDNSSWQGDLSLSYMKVGDAMSSQGDLIGALQSYRDSLEIAEKLGAQSPENAAAQGDLARVYWRTGSALAQAEPKSKSEAQAMVNKGHDILRQLQERARLTANQQEWLESIETDLRKLGSG